ncbi:MAG: DHHW family protein [Clostridia bacterium]|nr:DHHW family protein [Clostridia bacterium]
MTLKINAVIITAVIIIFTVLFFVLPKDEFSENENRSLAGLPQLDWEEMLSGEDLSDISDYITDHFPFRETFVRGKTAFEIEVLKMKYVNGIYIGNDGYYIEDYVKPENTEKIIDNINEFAANINVKADFMLVPTQVSIYNDKLPQYAQPLSQLKTIEKYYSSVNANCINVYDTLTEHKDNEQLFYKLDHHWTMDGAYYAYVEYCRSKGFTPVSRDEYSVEIIKDFRGTIYSKINYSALNYGEDMKIYNKAFDLNVVYDGRESNSVYNMEYANKKDKYSIFLNNINSFIEITNNDIDSDRSLVLTKDSYANSMVPFLLNHYKKIYVFDTRSYKGAVSDFVNENNVDDVLILYNVNTIDTDTGVNIIY